MGKERSTPVNGEKQNQKLLIMISAKRALEVENPTPFFSDIIVEMVENLFGAILGKVFRACGFHFVIVKENWQFGFKSIFFLNKRVFNIKGRWSCQILSKIVEIYEHTCTDFK